MEDNQDACGAQAPQSLPRMGRARAAVQQLFATGNQAQGKTVSTPKPDVSLAVGSGSMQALWRPHVPRLGRHEQVFPAQLRLTGAV